MAKVTFSRSDVMVINDRMSNRLAGPKAANYALSFTALPRSPSSAVAAKIMREVGVSNQKMSEAYRFASVSDFLCVSGS